MTGSFIVATMCSCGDNQPLGDSPDNVFAPHQNRRTGEPCKGLPLPLPGSRKSMSKMSWVSAWVAVVEANGSLPSILEDMTLDELTHLSEVAMNLDHQARLAWLRKSRQQRKDGDQ